MVLRSFYAITLASLLIRHGKTLVEQVQALSMMVLPGATSALFFAAGLFRLCYVASSPRSLDFPPASSMSHPLRLVGVSLISVGALIAALHAFTYCLVGNPVLAALQGSNALEVYVAITLVSDIGAAGILFFEVSRFQAFSTYTKQFHEQI